METRKSPGEEGFTVEFYKCFFDIAGNDLLNSLKAAYGNGEMSISQRRGSNNNDPKRKFRLTRVIKLATYTFLKGRL